MQQVWKKPQLLPNFRRYHLAIETAGGVIWIPDWGQAADYTLALIKYLEPLGTTCNQNWSDGLFLDSTSKRPWDNVKFVPCGVERREVCLKVLIKHSCSCWYTFTSPFCLELCLLCTEIRFLTKAVFNPFRTAILFDGGIHPCNHKWMLKFKLCYSVPYCFCTLLEQICNVFLPLLQYVLQIR